MSHEKGNLSINSENILPIIKKWLYSDTDIFLRELISNASDAIIKLQKLQEIGEANLVSKDENYFIDVILDTKNKIIKVIDNGIGMTAEEIKQFINQIAFSGANDFINKYKDKIGKENEIIGHFGLGFYSSFMVAETVQIDSLSYKENSKSAKWISDGGIEYEIDSSEKTTRGTEITLFISEENKEFLNEYKLKSIINKYCNFMPINIYFKNISENKENNKDENNKLVPLNNTKPLWVKSPSECSENEYKEFYKNLFCDFNDPLFWIHLNMDYPFKLKGILYFPKLKNELEPMEGQVKLYCNQVFVADNVKEVIPEFLLLLKGAIDCPEIPLNVSRSFLQNDSNVSKMSNYISKKVSDKLNSLFKKDKEKYCTYWKDISPFIKYGCIKEKSFYDKIKDSIIFKTTSDDYVTIFEYLDKNKEKNENKVFYVTDEKQQSQYIKLFKEQNIEAIILTTNLDNAFISYLETYLENVKFMRIDSNITDILKNNENINEESDKEKDESIINLFKENIKNNNIEIKVENFKTTSVPSLIILDEQSRRMKDMSKIFGNLGNNIPIKEELIINKNNNIIKTLIKIKDNEDKKDTVKLICNQIYDLAMLNNKTLDKNEMNDFIERSNKILELLSNL